MTILAWHFLYEGHKLRDGTVAPPNGEWLRFAGEPVLCEQGLHASVDAFDALQYAPGQILCRVECGGKIATGADKLVCTERRILARMDATDMLRYFARMQAVSVLHMWEPPQVVLDYLMTGDESIRAAAWAAARDAARAAAWAAAWDAARAAAWAAAWAAARAAARDAARAEFNALVSECFEGVCA